MNAWVPRGVALVGVALVVASLALPWGSLAEGQLRYHAWGLSRGGASCDWFVGFSHKALCQGSTNLAARAGLVLGAPLLVAAAVLGALRPHRARLLAAGILALAAAFMLRVSVTGGMIATAQRSITTDLVGFYAAVGAGALLGVAGALSSER